MPGVHSPSEHQQDNAVDNELQHKAGEELPITHYQWEPSGESSNFQYLQ